MKKILAVFLAAFMLLIPAVGMHVDEFHTYHVWVNSEDCVGCFDTFLIQYEDGEKSMMEIYGVGDGGAPAVLSEHPIYVTTELAISCRGWSGLRDQTAIDVYGYRINDGTPVYNAEFKTGAEQAVYNAGGDSRYKITVPIAGITEPTLITLMIKDVNGREYDIIEFSINGNYGGAETIELHVAGADQSIEAEAGDTVEVGVNVRNNTAVKSLKATLSWPEELALVNAEYAIASDGDTVAVPANGWESVSGSYEFSWAGGADRMITNDFTFVKLTFKVLSNPESVSFFPVTAEAGIGDAVSVTGNNVLCSTSNGGVIVNHILMGDVDESGEINNKDVVVLFRFLAGVSQFGTIKENAADVNGDGGINNKDVTELFRIYTDMEPVTATPSVTGISAENGRFLLYGVTEPGSIIRTVDARGKTETNISNNKYFYVEVEGSWGEAVSVYATANGKEESSAARVTLEATASANSVWVGRNSRIFYGGTMGFLTGNEANMGSLANLKTYISKKTIRDIQKATGKKTKLIYAIIPDPATAYYDEQPDYVGVPQPFNPAIKSFVSEIDGCHEDVYALDLIPVMRAHKDERIYFTTDTHYTELGAYYVYLDIMKRVRETYPSARVRTVENGDYTVEYYDVPGGDMCSMVGLSMHEIVPFFIANFDDTGSYYVSKRNDGIKSAGFGPRGWKRFSALENSDNPTAYFLGDSYGCYILPFIGANFSKVWTNEGVLWSYELDQSILEQNKPDYVILVVCQRNVGPDFMSNLVSSFSLSVDGFDFD